MIGVHSKTILSVQARSILFLSATLWRYLVQRNGTRMCHCRNRAPRNQLPPAAKPHVTHQQSSRGQDGPREPRETKAILKPSWVPPREANAWKEAQHPDTGVPQGGGWESGGWRMQKCYGQRHHAFTLSQKGDHRLVFRHALSYFSALRSEGIWFNAMARGCVIAETGHPGTNCPPLPSPMWRTSKAAEDKTAPENHVKQKPSSSHPGCPPERPMPEKKHSTQTPVSTPPTSSWLYQLKTR